MYSSSGVSSTGSLLFSAADESIGGTTTPEGYAFPQQTIVINGIDPFEDDPIQVKPFVRIIPKMSHIDGTETAGSAPLVPGACIVENAVEIGKLIAQPSCRRRTKLR